MFADVSRNPDTPTHDLQALATLLPSAWRLPVSMDRLVEMNPYAVNIRYADDWQEPRLQDAQRALALAKEIRAAVRAFLSTVLV